MRLQEPPDGTRVVTIRAAARWLEVGRELLEGLAQGGDIRAFCGSGASGNDVVLLDYEAVRALGVRLGRSGRLDGVMWRVGEPTSAAKG